MKQCSQCKCSDLSNFNKSSKSKDGLQPFCRDCNRKAHQRWYEENKDYSKKKARAYDKIYYERVDAFLTEYKSTNPCVDCKKIHKPWRMDFDHLDPSIKFDNIADMRQRRISLKRIKEEIVKCELVCANCHRDRTHFRRLNGTG